MTDRPSDGNDNSKFTQPNLDEGHDVPSIAKKQFRRSAVITSFIVTSLLLLISVALLIDHFVVAHSANSLLEDRQLGLSYASGDCTKAISLLTPVVAANELDYLAKGALGNCYAALAEYDQALTLLKDVVSAEPNLTNELDLASVAFNSGNIILSQSTLKAAIAAAVSPNDFLGIAAVAESYSFFSVDEIALGRIPSASRTYIWYGYDARAKLALGDSQLAVAAALQATRLAPESMRGQTLAQLGDIYEGALNYSAAASAYRSALLTKQQADPSSLYSSLSQCYIQLRQYSAAVAAAKSGIANSPATEQYGLELIEATAFADSHGAPQAIKILRNIIRAKLAPANDVALASALLSTLNG